MITAHLLLLFSAAPAIDEGGGSHPNLVQELVLADARKLSKDAAPYQRYFRVALPRAERNEFLTLFGGPHLNRLSASKQFYWPTFVSPEILRIDVRKYSWDELGKKANNVLLVWEKLAGRDPWFHQQAKVLVDKLELPVAWPGGYDADQEAHYARGVYDVTFRKGRIVPRPAIWLDQKDADELRKILCTEAPIIDAEWFLVQTARQRSIFGENEPGIGYMDFLAIRTRNDMFEQVGASFVTAKKRKSRWKGAVMESNVALHNRLVIILGAEVGGEIFGTLDTANPKDKGDLLRNLRDGEFDKAHKAEEWIFFRPNGLDGAALFNAAGERQAVAPDDVISSDDSKLVLDSNRKYRHNDKPVHVGISCVVGCHSPDDGLKDFDEQVRKQFKKGNALLLVDPDERVTRELADDYLTDLGKVLKRGRQRLVDAVKEVTTSKLNPDGWTIQELGLAYRKYFDRYAYRRRTLESAAYEMGVKPKDLLAGIKAHASQQGRGQTDIHVAAWITDPETPMKAQLFEERLPLLYSLAMGLAPPEEKIAQKEKKQ